MQNRHEENMPLLRRRLRCFYCGQQPSQIPVGNVRQFYCDKCEAHNYLDEKGQITDPPTQVTDPINFSLSPQPQYGRQVSPSVSTSPAAPESVFCDICLKNQHYYNDAVANYFPPFDDPSYSKYEAAYEDWKRNLEERYPQVCSDCLPRVRQKIRDTRYTTVTDDLRRKMLRTKRGMPFDYSQLTTGRGLFFVVSGVGWWSSILGQLSWHVLGARTNIQLSEYEGSDVVAAKKCALSFMGLEEVPLPCLWLPIPLATAGIGLGLLFCWWHAALIRKMQTTGGRMVGQSTYLKLQIVLLTIRSAALWLLRSPGFLTPQAFQGAHLAALTFFFITTVVSLFTVKVDYTPRFSFKELAEPTHARPPAAKLLTTPRKPSPPRVEPFPINQLASAPQNERLFSPTPTESTVDDYPSDSEAGDDVVGDAMDWTPTRRESLGLQPRRIAATSTLQETLRAAAVAPSPFHGTLPAAPITPAQRLRNPPQRPVFQKTPLDQQQDFFSNMMKQQEQKPSGGFNLNPSHPRTTDFQLGSATLQLKEDPVETGLESIFDSVFTIRDDPAEVQARANMQRRTGKWRQYRAIGYTIFLYSIPLLVGFLVYSWSTWAGESVQQGWNQPVQLPTAGDGSGTSIDMSGYAL